MDTKSIRELIEEVDRGQVRIPAFQRGFIWEPDRVAFFLDSVFKQYPFGALLFWRANEVLKYERSLGPFKLPTPKADYPIDYVLDGQQRITSLYGTFQTTQEVEQTGDWRNIYYDYSLPFDIQDTQFFALQPDEVDPPKHFPLRCLFDSIAYRRETTKLDQDTAKKIDDMQTRFKETKIPVEIIKPVERSSVAVIFERINRQGVPLDTLQLLSAWTWSEDFQLQTEFEELSTDLEEYGFRDVDRGENLLLRCCAGVLIYDPSPEVLVRISGEEVRKRFSEVRNGIRGALDFLQMNLSIESIVNLPFQTLLVPLAVFFAGKDDLEIKTTEAQRKQLLRWIWRASFGRRYSGGLLRHLKEDIENIRVLKAGQESKLGSFACNIGEDFFLSNNFTISAVNSKTAVLLLTQERPHSFVTGTPVDLARTLRDFNRTEFHHLMPNAFLNGLSQKPKSHPDCLANIAFMTRAENRQLGGVSPSQYRPRMAGNVDEILEHAICPKSLFDDSYDKFVQERAKLLFDKAKLLFE